MAVVVTQLVVDASGSKTGVADFIAAMKKAEQQAVATGDATAKSFERVQAQWTNSLAKVDPLVKAQIAMEKDLARQHEINAKAVKLGITTQEAANDQIVKLTQYHKGLAASVGQTTKATEAHVNASKLQRYEMINLGRQLQDVGVSLFSGQSPLTVLVQQGSQIADISASSGVSMSNMFKQAGSAITSVLTPMRLVTGGVIGLGIAAAYTAIQWDDANKAMERSMIGPGARTGTGVNDISKFAKDNASAFGLSVSEARNAAIEFTKTGEIQIASLKGLGEAVHGYAVLTGTEAPEASKKLAGILSGDLGKAVLELSKTYSGFDANTRSSVQSMAAAGQRIEAQQIILDKMKESNLKAAESVGVMTKAWTAFKNVASEVVNPSPPQRESPQERLDTAKGRQAEFQSGKSPFQNEKGFGNAIAADVAEAQKALDTFNAQKATAELANLSMASPDQSHRRSNRLRR